MTANRLPESGSGSFQTHLSTTNSQQRLRATNAYASANKESLLVMPTPPNPSNFAMAFRVLFPFPDFQASIQFQDHHLSSRSWKGVVFKWMALVYCFLSVIFTSTALYKYLYLSHSFRISANVNELVPSALEFLSPEQRLSRVSPNLRDPRILDPYLLFAVPRAGITACLWTTDEEVDHLVSWVSQWSGPISLVVTTATHPGSASHTELLRRLKTLKIHPSLSGLSLHLLHVSNHQYSPSAYLNLARLFASSPTVMLFPANLSNTLPSNLYNILTSHHSHHVARKPLLITDTATSPFSIPALTPILLPRNYQLWCTERPFMSSRTADWDDCLWQLWLEESGIGHANLTLSIGLENPMFSADGVLSSQHTEKQQVRNRLGGRYRAELCELAIKRLDTSRTSKNGKRRLHWVKSFCRQTESAAKISGA